MAEINPADLAAKFINYTSRHLFLTGKAGTGKTTFLRNLISKTHKRAVIVAPTGIAAINAGGVTIHSLFQLPFGAYLPKKVTEEKYFNQPYNTPQSIVRHLQMNSSKRRIFLDLELLVIDEVSMLRADLLDAIDMVLRYIRRNNESFGGVQVLFIGDLHQLPPVVKNAEWPLLSEFYQSAYFFDALALKQHPPVYIELDKVYRQADEVFIKLLNNLRNNTVTPEDVALLQQHYRENFKPDVKDKYITLTTHNQRADSLNQESLEALKSRSFYYKAQIEDDFSASAYPAEDRLELKVGAQVMFIKNDPSPDKRFYNGKIATVVSLSEDEIEVETAGERERILVEKYTWKNIRYTTNKVTHEIKEEVIGKFAQYPIKLAWAITVHKSQGLTFEKAIVDIGQAFAPGQIYVALSRLRSLDGLVLTSPIMGSGIRQDQNVSLFSRNKVAAEVLVEQIKLETDVFLKGYLLRCFDLTSLDNYVYEHVQSYTKDISKSAKQKHHKWAQNLLKDLTEQKRNAQKFLVQVQRLCQDKSAEGIETLFKRTMAAENYFNPILQQLSEQIFSRMELVKQDKQTAAFLAELVEMESLFYEQFKNIRKATALLRSIIDGKDFTRADVESLLNEAERSAKIKKVVPATGTLDFDAKKPKVKAKKTTAKKAPKEDTKELSLQLLKAGKTPLEIARERKMVIGTIEGHLAHFVANQQIDASEVLSSRKLTAIAAAIRSLKTMQMNQIREHLGRDFSFGEIKIGVAAYLAEGN